MANSPANKEVKIGGGSTTGILVNLQKGMLSNLSGMSDIGRFTGTDPLKNPVFCKMTVEEGQLAKARLAIERPNHLEESINRIKGQVEELPRLIKEMRGSMYQGIPLSTLNDQTGALNIEVKERITQQRTLADNIHQLIDKKDEIFKNIVAGNINKTMPKGETNHYLESLDKKIREYSSDIYKLLINENSLQRKLDAFEVETTQAIKSTGGVPITATTTETPRHR